MTENPVSRAPWKRIAAGSSRQETASPFSQPNNQTLPDCSEALSDTRPLLRGIEKSMTENTRDPEHEVTPKCTIDGPGDDRRVFLAKMALMGGALVGASCTSQPKAPAPPASLPNAMVLVNRYPFARLSPARWPCRRPVQPVERSRLRKTTQTPCSS